MLEFKNVSGFSKVDNLSQSFLNLKDNEFQKINKYLACIKNDYGIPREESKDTIKSLLNIVMLEMTAHFKTIIEQPRASTSGNSIDN